MSSGEPLIGRQGLVTVGFVSHHVEALPFIRKQMERHETLVLEEPSAPSFPGMLNGHLSVDDYLLEIDSEFPRFDRLMCGLLMEFHGMGRRIIQVEPYLERLIEIHERFADGKTVADVMASDSLRNVYRAERAATGALIAYYSKSVSASFSEVVEAVKIFARVDAGRLALRDRLRARAIASAADAGESILVEAGYIHYSLYRHLLNQMGVSWKVRVIFLLEPVIRELNGKRRNFGPGDILTLRYALNRHPSQALADLLAARSLIFIKLIETEELLPGASLAPHAEDEIRVGGIVDQLSFDDCENLFNTIRLLKRDFASQTVEDYLASMTEMT
jgi:hypothetical protein